MTSCHTANRWITSPESIRRVPEGAISHHDTGYVVQEERATLMISSHFTPVGISSLEPDG